MNFDVEINHSLGISENLVQPSSTSTDAAIDNASALEVELKALTDALLATYDGLIGMYGIEIARRLRNHTFYAIRELNYRESGRRPSRRSRSKKARATAIAHCPATALIQ